MEILALQEIWQKGRGIRDKDSFSLSFGGKNKQEKNGTDFMISSTVRENIMQFGRVNWRTTYLKLRNQIACIAIINIYASTEETKEEEKDEFQLRDLCDEQAQNMIH